MGIVPDEIDIADSGSGSLDDGAADTEDEVGVTGDDGDTTTGDEGTTESSTETGMGEMGETSDSSEGTSDADEESDDSVGETEETGGSPCEEMLGGPVEVGTVMVTVAGASEDMGSCGGADGPEQGYTFEAPEAGSYDFSVTGQDFSPVLYVRSTCEAEELACDDGEPPMISMMMEAQQVVYVFVDSKDGTGAAELLISGP